MDIKTVEGRAKLDPRREPYWTSLGTGRHIGYRVTSTGGTWQARVYDPSTHRRQTKSLDGDMRGIMGKDQYTEAVKFAQVFFAHIDKGGRTEAITVAQAWQNYIARTRDDDMPKMGKRAKRKRGADAAEQAALILERRFRRQVEHDPIAKIAVAKLQPRHVEAWVKRLAREPAKQPKRGPSCRSKKPQASPKTKSDATVNRDVGVMKAALNLALRDRYVTSDDAWRDALAPLYIDDKDARRDTVLSVAERKALLDAIDDASLKVFVNVLCRLPLRPGAAASLEVRDLKGDVLTVRKDKGHPARSFTLSRDNAAMLRKCARGKLPRAPLFTQANGRPWDKDAWKKPIKAAVLKAGLPPESTAYTLRHSAITDYVNGGAPSYEIANIAGTSARMIEKFYFHSQADTSRRAQDNAGW